MLFVVIGIVLLLMKAFGVSFLADWSWWWCGVPFLVAVLYWELIESPLQLLGKKEMRAQRKKVDARRKKYIKELEGEAEKKNGLFRRGDKK